MSVSLRSTTLVALFFSGPLLAYDGIVHFSGAVVEPTCGVDLSEVTGNGARVRLNDCTRAVMMMLNEPRSDLPSVSYRLTDLRGKALGQGVAASGDADSVIREITKGGVAADRRQVVLVAEYL
ncbi:hypothetical protein ACLUTX_01285 [Enterobacterales bacterium AE_CKDN230030158-1A_HGKHYDSX7]